MVTNCGQFSSPVLVLLAFLFLHGAPSRAADDTIADGQPLYGGQSLVSKRGKFELGFFQPGTYPSRNQIPKIIARVYRSLA